MHRFTRTAGARLAALALAAARVGCSGSGHEGSSRGIAGPPRDGGILVAPHVEGDRRKSGGPDGGGDPDGSVDLDGSVHRDGGDGERDAQCPDAATPPAPCSLDVLPSGDQLLASSTAQVMGVTSDGQVLYVDAAAGQLAAAALGSSAVTVLGPWDPSADVFAGTVGKSAVYFTGVTGGVGALTLWRKDQKAPLVIAPNALVTRTRGRPFELSPDGSLILYVANFNPATHEGDILMSPTDGGPAVLLVSRELVADYCPPQFLFDANMRAVVASCTGTSGSIKSFATRGPPMVFATARMEPRFWIDATRTQIAFATPAGLQVGRLTDGAVTTVDPAAKSVRSAAFTADAASIIYTRNDPSTLTGRLYRSAIAAPAPAPVLATPVLDILAVAPNDDSLYLTTGFDGAGLRSDLYLLRAGATQPETLSIAPAATLRGPAFTADGTQALYAVDVTSAARDLHHAGLREHGEPGARAGIVTHGAGKWFTTAGAKVVYAGHGSRGSPTTADIEVADVGVRALPTAIVDEADADFFVSADRTTVVYSWSACPGTLAGIWATPLP